MPYEIKEGANKCPLWYDDDCPYLMENGYCELADPKYDCDDFACYCESDEGE